MAFLYDCQILAAFLHNIYAVISSYDNNYNLNVLEISPRKKFTIRPPLAFWGTIQLTFVCPCPFQHCYASSALLSQYGDFPLRKSPSRNLKQNCGNHFYRWICMAGILCSQIDFRLWTICFQATRLHSRIWPSHCTTSSKQFCWTWGFLRTEEKAGRHHLHKLHWELGLLPWDWLFLFVAGR